MWFTVTIYLRCSELVEGESLLQETIHLIKAESEEEAMLKSQSLGNKLEHKYVNVNRKEVLWALVGINKPQELLDKLTDGAEVYSRFISEEVWKSLRDKY